MAYTQLIPFNPSAGGTVPDMCLNNVRLGYGIANKYDTAWEAWEHTQQHPDRNIPGGLAVPLFYSYTTTIDGVTQNYGHINVQLPSGIVWSDGNFYPSIESYTSQKLPVFVGWGESVNDFKIIQEEEDMFPNEGDIQNAYQQANNRAATPDEVKAYLSIPWNAPTGLFYGKVLVDFANAQKAPIAGFTPITEQLFTKNS